MSEKSLFEMLGGANAVDIAVENFYRKVLMDERVSHFFEDVDMDQQIAKQKGFLTLAFGGPNQYTGLDMRKGHAHLVKRGLNDSHVDVILELLGDTLKELDIPKPLIDRVIQTAESARSDVLNR
jgi:hemoglobin